MEPEGTISQTGQAVAVAIVEDDRAIRAALVDLLDSAGYCSTGFESGEAFLDADAARSCDVVITDIQLGGRDGLELLALLRETPGRKLPVIVITALTEESLEERATARGCHAFLRKPFDPDILIGHVRDAVALTRRDG